jgi:Kef-type K+ transport system membrane component KefB
MDRHDIAMLLLQLSIMLGVALAFGRLLTSLGQLALFGELIGGVVLGPTVIGTLFPDFYQWLFPNSGTAALARETLLNVGMLFFLFAAGLHVRVDGVKGSATVFAGTFSVAIPFVIGVAAVLAWPAMWGSQAAGEPLRFAVLIGTALSISALPVIAKILIELELIGGKVGTTIMMAATVTDVLGWCLFALAINNFAAAPAEPTAAIAALLLAGLGAVLFLGRSRLQTLHPALIARLARMPNLLGLSSLLVLAAAAASEILGVHAFLGAFFVGVFLEPAFRAKFGGHQPPQQVLVNAITSLYFLSIGLRTNFATNFDASLVAWVIVIACVGKVIGGGLGAWLGGMPARESLAVGIGLNARGAMEIVLATIALQFRFIDERVFVALVTMAMVTSIASGFGIRRLFGKAPAPQLVGPAHRRFLRGAGPRAPMSGYEIGGAVNRLSRAASRPDSSADRST